MPKIHLLYSRMFRCATMIFFFSSALFFAACQNSPGDIKSVSDSETIVQSITNQKEFNEIMMSSHHQLVVIDFYADWCSPCRELAPLLETVAREHQHSARFYRLNIDELRMLSMKNGVTGIPYVAFFKAGKKIHSLLGVWPKKSYVGSVKKFAVPAPTNPTRKIPQGAEG